MFARRDTMLAMTTESSDLYWEIVPRSDTESASYWWSALGYTRAYEKYAALNSMITQMLRRVEQNPPAMRIEKSAPRVDLGISSLPYKISLASKRSGKRASSGARCYITYDPLLTTWFIMPCGLTAATHLSLRIGHSFLSVRPGRGGGTR